MNTTPLPPHGTTFPGIEAPLTCYTALGTELACVFGPKPEDALTVTAHWILGEQERRAGMP